MSQVDTFATDRRNWFERLFKTLIARPEGEMHYDLPPDSLFAGNWNPGVGAIADVPDKIKAQIREEAVLDTFNRLEASLRLLLYATTPEKEPPDVDRCRQILNVWRYELEHRVNLSPDTYCGAVQRYEPEMETAYTIDGRCEPGTLLRIRVPCWRMHDRVVIRGEAELCDGPEGEADEVVSSPGLTMSAVRAADPYEPAPIRGASESECSGVSAAYGADPSVASPHAAGAPDRGIDLAALEQAAADELAAPPPPDEPPGHALVAEDIDAPDVPVRRAARRNPPPSE